MSACELGTKMSSGALLPQETSSSRKLSGGTPRLRTRCFVAWNATESHPPCTCTLPGARLDEIRPAVQLNCLSRHVFIAHHHNDSSRNLFRCPHPPKRNPSDILITPRIHHLGV